jgi:hypothetical protein
MPWRRHGRNRDTVALVISVIWLVALAVGMLHVMFTR